MYFPDAGTVRPFVYDQACWLRNKAAYHHFHSLLASSLATIRGAQYATVRHCLDACIFGKSIYRSNSQTI